MEQLSLTDVMASLDMLSVYEQFFEHGGYHAIVDENGIYVYMSKLMIERMGYPRDEIIGQPYARFVHPDDEQRTRQVWFDNLGTGFVNMPAFQNRHVDAGGEAVWLMWSNVKAYVRAYDKILFLWTVIEVSPDICQTSCVLNRHV